ncbi:MAG: isocitrate/isopropylmalate family dehydrogenase [Bryobacteraceae bacterium]
MKPHRIALLPGDGIGPEVIREAVRVLRAVTPYFTYEEYSVGAQSFSAEAIPYRRASCSGCVSRTRSCWGPWACPLHAGPMAWT